MRHRSCLSLCWMLLSLIVMPHPQMCARAGDSAQARTRFATPPQRRGTSTFSLCMLARLCRLVAVTYGAVSGEICHGSIASWGSD